MIKWVDFKWLKSILSREKMDFDEKMDFELASGLRTAYNIRFANVAILIVVLAFTVIDYFITDNLVYRNLNILRLVFVLLFFVPFIVFFLKNKGRIPQYLLVINALGFGLFLFGLSYIAGDNQRAIFNNTIGVFMFNVVVYVLFGLKRRYAIMVSFFLLLILTENFNKVLVANKADIIVWFLLASCFSILLNMYIEAAYRKSFIVNQKLKEANQSRYQLFNIVSHDLKNIISAQSTITDFLHSAHETISTKERNNLLDLLNKSSNDALSMFEDLMIWIKSQMDKIQPTIKKVDFDDFIQNQIEHFEIIAENKEISIEIENVDLEGIQIDATILSLAFRNILGNAIKYSKSGSIIKVKANKHTNGFQLKVIDEGIGISSEKIDDLFKIDKITSTNGTSGEKGTGMGLVITRDLLDQINGNIEVKSRRGIGTSVIINIPELIVD